jgi:CDP-diacylglycerol--glycerol-3-phosphate 3-phosphatidyltransferase
MNLPNLITVLAARAHGGGVRLPGAGPRIRPSTVPTRAALVWTAFVLFLIAAFTDFLDGYLARKWNLVTAFGRVADPFADKVLIAGSLHHAAAVSGRDHDVLTTWYVVIVIAREFLVTAIRGVVEASGRRSRPTASASGRW